MSDKRVVVLAFLSLSAVGAGVSACGSEFAECEESGTCEPNGGAGVGGAGGTGGAGASGGAGQSGRGGVGGGSAASGGSGVSGVGGGGLSGGSDGLSGGGGEGAQGGEAGELGGGDGGASGVSGEGGEGGEAGFGEPSCDGAKAPAEDGCVVNERYGVFVSGEGDDAEGEGTRERPFRTLARAIEVALESDKRVYACADGGRYRDSLSLGANANGLEMFGGFSCADWSYSAERTSRVTSQSAVSLRVEGVSGLRAEDFEFEAGDGITPGESSVAVMVVNATGVVFRGVRMEAGRGMDGADGVRDDFVFPSAAELVGNSAVGSAGGAAKDCACPGGATTSGGNGGTAVEGGSAGGDRTPDYEGKGGEGGTAALACGAGGGGLDGANGPAAAASLGAMLLGTLDATGWKSAAGAAGVHGLPGQGGGGGMGATLAANGGGGGGGCGGCGGAGGPAGMGGGGSIALVVFESEVTVTDSELESGDAGRGGNGASGQAGQMERGWGGNQVSGGCQGGAGGLGGKGAAGGGGAGGVSVGVLWTGGLEPLIEGTEFSLGEFGPKGLGGEPNGGDGIEGVAEEVLEVP